MARGEPMFLSFLSGTCFSAPFVRQQPSCLTHEENTSALCGKIKGGRGQGQSTIYVWLEKFMPDQPTSIVGSFTKINLLSDRHSGLCIVIIVSSELDSSDIKSSVNCPYRSFS